MRSRASVANKPSPAAAPAASPPAAMEPRGSIDTSKQAVDTKQQALVDAKVAEDQDRRDAAKRSARAAAPTRASELSMGKHGRIVDQLFDLPEPMEVYERLRRALSFGGRVSTMGYGDLADALDAAEENAFEGTRLSINMKVALDAYTLDAEVVRGAMREQALADLQAQKDAGHRSKAITNDDITAVMAAKFSDEYRDLETRLGRARRSSAAIEDLADRLRERARDLRALVAKSRDA